MARSACKAASFLNQSWSQRSDLEQFLFETTVEASVRDTIRELANVNNLRQRITRLKLEGEELAKYGPAKQPDKQGIDQYSEEPIEKGPHYLQDPTGRRTGNGVLHARVSCHKHKVNHASMQQSYAHAAILCPCSEHLSSAGLALTVTGALKKTSEKN